jgi:tRNA-splicing ligase RtcB (3'-phosphate/5'-hydroxy nucleic acid ligase)
MNWKLPKMKENGTQQSSLIFEKEKTMIEKQIPLSALEKITDYQYEIPTSYREDMRVPARLFLSHDLLSLLEDEKSLWQLVNMTTLPGIQRAAFAMPDIHQGYGFPIGGVAATAIDEDGVISPGGIGYDINCGVRLLTIGIKKEEFLPKKEAVASELFKKVPSGVGRSGLIKLSDSDMDLLLKDGSVHAVRLGFGNDDDVLFCEENGKIAQADPSLISDHAKKRAFDQLGTLGSGNHFLEFQFVDEIFDEQTARIFGIEKDQITVMIHCGSRGLGHQTCTDYVKIMNTTYPELVKTLPDRELIYAPFSSDTGTNYFHAMAAAANFAFANRHVIGHQVRTTLEAHFGSSVNIKTCYDISHNIGKIETHSINNSEKKMFIHRKGATRAFPKNHPENPEQYMTTGHPVFIPGTMGTASYVLVGTEENNAFYSTCHGAGRVLSRTSAKKNIHGSELRRILEKQGITIQSKSNVGLAEEAPRAYKDIEKVIEIVQGAHLANPVARLVPLAVIKG